MNNATLHKKTLSVSAIENGTVIDHIPPGQATRIIQLLSLAEKKYSVMVGMNLKSTHKKRKDLIKIEKHLLADQDVDRITAFAPSATINLIKDFQVVKKISAHLPDSIAAVFVCPNAMCITQNEPINTLFYLTDEGKKITLRCHFCEKQFDRDDVELRYRYADI